MRYVCQVENIQWDTDGAEPPSDHWVVIVECDTEEEVEEAVSDKLTEDHGFCHKGFNMVIIDRLQETHAMISMWTSVENKQGHPAEWDWGTLLDLGPDEEIEIIWT